MKRIMCFGDSLTWGYRAASDGGPPTRYPASERWTGLLAEALRGEAVIVEEGLNGRTTDLDDPEAPYRNGAAYLPVALRSQTPLDQVVLMLGTNDSKAVFARRPLDIAVALAGLARQITSFTGPDAAGAPPPRLLMVCPPPVHPEPGSWFGQIFDGANDRLTALPALLANVAESRGACFLDAGQVVTTEGADGIHFSEANNRAFAAAVTEAVRHQLA